MPESPSGGGPPQAPIRVLMIGGTTLFRAGLRAVIEQATGIAIVGEGNTLIDALEDAKGVSTDIMLLDTLDAPDLVVQTLENVRQSNAAVRVLIMTMRSEAEMIGRMVIAGARG